MSVRKPRSHLVLTSEFYATLRKILYFWQSWTIKTQIYLRFLHEICCTCLIDIHIYMENDLNIQVNWLTTLRYARNLNLTSCCSFPPSCDITGNVKIVLWLSDVAIPYFEFEQWCPSSICLNLSVDNFLTLFCKFQVCKWEFEVWIYANGI